MSEQQKFNVKNELTNLEREAMFQVARFLQKFPQTQRAHQALVKDLTDHPELLPLRTDFEGNTHLQTYDELVRLPCRPLNVGKIRENLYQSETSKCPEIDARRAKLGLAQHAPSRLLAGLGSDDRLAKVWCTGTGILLRSLQGHRSVISDMAISKDGYLLATASEDTTVLVWDLEKYQVVNCLRMDDAVTSIAFSPSPLIENRYIVTTSDNWYTWIAKYERIQGTTSFGELNKIKPINAVGRVRMKCSAFNHTGSLFAVSGTDGLIRVFSTIALEDCKVTEEKKEGSGDTNVLESGEKGRSDEDEEEIDILDVEKSLFTGSPRYTESNIIESPINVGSTKISASPIIPYGPSSPLHNNTADIDSDEDAYSVGSSFSFGPMSPPSNEQQNNIPSQNIVISQAHTPDRSQVRSQALQPIQTKTQQIEEKRRSVKKAEKDNKSSTNHEISNPNAGQTDKKDNKKNDVSKLFGPFHISDLDGHFRTVNSLEFAHGDNRLLSGSDDGTARIWRYNYLKQQWTSITLVVSDKTPESDCRVTAMRWSADDALVVLGDNKGNIRVYDSQNGELKIEIHAHSNDLYVLDIHPHDWRTIMSAGYDGKISMWDIQDGRNVKTWDRSSLNFIDENLDLKFHDGKFRDDGK
ncbi:9422_t:CDS:2 [Funneliformis caledonium]|uniref:9422_t:CDS:1 n=1 Tax=Funneliformis caledonium TaxID=1117310 RepID=A0A9N8VUC4_9GLOM|nr:9422_t:CDS:2 [Funneliformis caledonium]